MSDTDTLDMPQDASPDNRGGVVEVENLGEMLGVSRQTIFRWIKSGKLPPRIKLPGQKPFWASDVIQGWLSDFEASPKGSRVVCRAMLHKTTVEHLEKIAEALVTMNDNQAALIDHLVGGADLDEQAAKIKLLERRVQTLEAGGQRALKKIKGGDTTEAGAVLDRILATG